MAVDRVCWDQDDYMLPLEAKDPFRELYPFTEVAQRVEERLNMGAERYGDSAYVKKGVLAELEEEILDCMAYIYFLFLKVQRLRATTAGAGAE